MSAFGVDVLSSATQETNVQESFYILQVGFYKLVSDFRHMGTPWNGQFWKNLRPALSFCSLFPIRKGAIKNFCKNDFGRVGLLTRNGSWLKRRDKVEARPLDEFC